ncbi:MAG: FAD-binding oxidoreductase [Deltaproteobacteria bacterium]|nr:FAD-binding oxidoreductase [Deltaproteobacteria bacterium]
MKNCDFLVIGAGIAGASVASKLAQHGKVIVLERERVPGYHTTGRSAAVLSVLCVSPNVYALGTASLEFFKNPPADFCDVPLGWARPYMMIATDEQDEAYNRCIEEAALTPCPYREIETAEILNLCPVIRPDKVRRGILDEAGWELDVNALHQGYLRGLKRQGGEVITNADVTRLERINGKWVVETSAGQFSASVVVNASGAWCDVIAQRAGLEPVGIRPLRRTVFAFDAPAGAAVNSWPFVYDVGDQFYFKLENGTILASPAEEVESPPCDVQADYMDIAIGADRIQQVTTLDISHIRNKWAGLRTFAPDRELVLGFDAKAPGFFWLGGQGGIGIMTAPAVSDLSASLILNGTVPEALIQRGLQEAKISPKRFAK